MTHGSGNNNVPPIRRVLSQTYVRYEKKTLSAHLLSSTFRFPCNVVTHAHLLCNRWLLPRSFIRRDMIQSSELKILQHLHGSDIPTFVPLTQTLVCRRISIVCTKIQTPNTLCPRNIVTVPHAVSTISPQERLLHIHYALPKTMFGFTPPPPPDI
jgi:hypothetical protein